MAHRNAPEIDRKLIEDKNGGWVYTEQDPGAQNENPG